jgi:hypothetical protein
MNCLSGRVQVRSNYGGPIDTFLHVLREEGWTSLYAGLAPALIGNAYAQGTHTPLLPHNLLLFTDSCACAVVRVRVVCRVRVRWCVSCRWSCRRVLLLVRVLPFRRRR